MSEPLVTIQQEYVVSTARTQYPIELLYSLAVMSKTLPKNSFNFVAKTVVANLEIWQSIACKEFKNDEKTLKAIWKHIFEKTSLVITRSTLDVLSDGKGVRISIQPAGYFNWLAL